MASLRTGVLVSGRGSNLQALIDSSSASDWPAEVVTVISNVPGAGGLDRADRAGIPSLTIDHRDYESRENFEEAVHAALVEANVELVCLAGFMRLLTESFVARWTDRLINIHPSLLPSYKGLHSHERALADGVKIAGCTVHFVRPAMDAGPIIVQAAVPVLDGDDAGSLAARVLTAEHLCYPLAVRLIAEGRVRVDNEIVRIDGDTDAGTVLLNPS